MTHVVPLMPKMYRKVIQIQKLFSGRSSCPIQMGAACHFEPQNSEPHVLAKFAEKHARQTEAKSPFLKGQCPGDGLQCIYGLCHPADKGHLPVLHRRYRTVLRYLVAKSYVDCYEENKMGATYTNFVCVHFASPFKT
jgi:hypothetical protein